MNKIVLVGNGFDIACGLKTSYDDFILWYLKKSILESLTSENNKYSDPIIDIKVTSERKTVNDQSLSLSSIIQNIKKLEDLFDCENISFNLPGRESRKLQEHGIKCTFNSSILKYSMDRHNWSNIEEAYYHSLINRYKSFSSKQREEKYQAIDLLKTLNSHLNFIKDQLITYLTKIDSSIDVNKHTNKYLKDIFYRIHSPSRRSPIRYSIPIEEIENRANDIIYYLNFNYTKLLDSQLQHFNVYGKNTIIHNIHGYIDDPKTIIFGYGDDSHNEYYNLEQSGVDDFIINIKSFYYPSNEIYQTVLNTLDNAPFEVIVLGHSLGLSDRVLLKTIFEHELCNSIRLFHRNSIDNHIKKRLALSRHFDDKIIMRERIVSFDPRDILDSDAIN